MIVVEVRLHTRSGKRTVLNTLILDNVTSDAVMAAYRGRRCDYRCRVLRKGEEWLDLAYGHKPIREAKVEGHPRIAKPVLNLVYKALVALGYDR